MQIVSNGAMDTICMKCQSLFFLGKLRKIFHNVVCRKYYPDCKALKLVKVKWPKSKGTVSLTICIFFFFFFFFFFFLMECHSNQSAVRMELNRNILSYVSFFFNPEFIIQWTYYYKYNGFLPI